MLISIGYSACHWCHVMAHESFEDEAIARLMNDSFVCIKVDREELPDVDQLYMDACQLINGSGGWPLNAFVFPDQRPVHAMTYAPKANWEKLLTQIHHLYQTQPERAEEYAQKLSAGIGNMNTAPLISEDKQVSDISAKAVNKFKELQDKVFGGMNRAPKFPMPQNQKYLLQHSSVFDSDSSKAALFTLQQMALGGIHDVVGGGFARYSVDEKWFAPHFEKMLYDNAQLLGVYAYAYKQSGDLFYKEVADKILSFCQQKMQSPDGLYYSAYDADSEGIEGLYYTWTWQELESLLKDDTIFFSQYFQCRRDGNWEHGRNILFAIDRIEKAAETFEMDPLIFRQKIESCLSILSENRNTRVSPGLDDKCICSWNALMLKGLAEHALFCTNKQSLQMAEKLHQNMRSQFFKGGDLYRTPNSIKAYLEDYATYADALITLYQTSFKEELLLEALNVSQNCIDKFYRPESAYFAFTEKPGIAGDKFDINDDVINSGNSTMAHVLYKLGWYFDKQDYLETSTNMLKNMSELMSMSSPWYSHWLSLQLFIEGHCKQYIFTGPESLRTEFPHHAYTQAANALFGYVSEETHIPLLRDKVSKGEKRLYICEDKSCGLPQSY